MDARRKPRRRPMKKIDNKQYRMVTFSKRRRGLFSMAERLRDLTGSEVAVVVFSEAGRPYVHGSPETLDRFLAAGGFESDGGEDPIRVEEWIDGIDRALTQGDLKLEELAAMRRAAEEVRESVVGRLRRNEEDLFVGSLLCASCD